MMRMGSEGNEFCAKRGCISNENTSISRISSVVNCRLVNGGVFKINSSGSLKLNCFYSKAEVILSVAVSSVYGICRQ
jgi:hypothetical protein